MDPMDLAKQCPSWCPSPWLPSTAFCTLAWRLLALAGLCFSDLLRANEWGTPTDRFRLESFSIQ